MVAPPTGVWVEPSSAGTSVTVASTSVLAGQPSVGSVVVVVVDVLELVVVVLDVLVVVLVVVVLVVARTVVELEGAGCVVVLVLDVIVVVVAVEVVVVVVMLHCAGGAPASSGTATMSAQSVSNAVTQSTQSTTSCALAMARTQLAPAKGTTAGHWATKPTSPGATAPASVHPVDPPHTLQMVATFLCSALSIATRAFPSPGSGHAFW
jgi:hypothetical protein